MADQTPPRPAPPPRSAPRAPEKTADALRDGVRRQRQHIKDLTGQDPLRGGVDD